MRANCDLRRGKATMGPTTSAGSRSKANPDENQGGSEGCTPGVLTAVQRRYLHAGRGNRARGGKAGSTVGKRLFPKGDQRALWAQKEADLGPRKAWEGIRPLEEISRTWGRKTPCDLARPIISFREHCCASWTTCLAKHRALGLTFTQRPQSYMAPTCGPFLCPARIP